MKKTLLIITSIILFFSGCKKFDTIEASKVEITNETINVGWDYIKLNIEYNYPVELESVTLYLSEKDDMGGAKAYECYLEGKTFSVEVDGLKGRTKYYYRFEFDNGYDTYKNEISNIYCDGVDLGLPSGLKWATCNVGATSPEDYGNYYAWGETETKDTYDYDNSVTDGLSYSALQSQGYIDDEGNLTPSHDVATANWGGAWRMPTEDEQRELLKNCEWEWTTQNGVNGYKVIGPNGNHIFLPAAGYRNGSSLDVAGSYGYYWSSTPDASNTSRACSLLFWGSCRMYYSCYRYVGCTVRPITE